MEEGFLGKRRLSRSTWPFRRVAELEISTVTEGWGLWGPALLMMSCGGRRLRLVVEDCCACLRPSRQVVDDSSVGWRR